MIAARLAPTQPSQPRLGERRVSALLLGLWSWMALAELPAITGVSELTLQQYDDLFRNELMRDQDEQWRQAAPEAETWRQPPPPPGESGSRSRLQWGYDPAREHVRNLDRLQQNPAPFQQPAPTSVIELRY